MLSYASSLIQFVVWQLAHLGRYWLGSPEGDKHLAPHPQEPGAPVLIMLAGKTERSLLGDSSQCPSVESKCNMQLIPHSRWDSPQISSSTDPVTRCLLGGIHALANRWISGQLLAFT